MITSPLRISQRGTVLRPSTVLSPVSTAPVACTQASPPPTITNFCGKLLCSNSSGSTVGVLAIVVGNTNVQANSVILVSCERAAQSNTGTPSFTAVQYLANVEASSLVPGVSFMVNIQRRAGTSILASGAENMIVNYMIVN